LNIWLLLAVVVVVLIRVAVVVLVDIAPQVVTH
jgi:hypothetical protein